MKKSLILLAVTFLVMAGVASVMVPTVFGEADNLKYQEKTVYGDPNYLDGMKLDFEVVNNFSFKWDCNVSFENGLPVSTSKFRNIGFNGFRYKPVSSVRTLQITSLLDPSLIYQKYIGEFTPGKPENRTIHVKEAIDYYPIVSSVYFPEGQVFYYNDDYQSDTDYGEYNNAALSRYFRIPVTDDEQMTLEYDGSELSTEVSTDLHDTYNFSIVSCYRDDSFYFSFSNRTIHGNIVDTSLLPQGYGIYRLPVVKVNSDDYKGYYHFEGLDIDVDNISCLYNVDEEVRIVSLEYLEDKNQLLMLGYKDNSYYMEVIDPDSGKQLDRRKLNETEEYVYPGCALIEGREFICYSNGLFQILETDDQGMINCRFEYMLTDNEKNDASFPLNRLSDYGNFMHNSEFVISGDRLTAISSERDSAKINIAIFEGNKEKYYGHLYSSLDLAEGSYNCQLYINEVTGV